MSRRLLAPIVLVVALAACGGGGEQPSTTNAAGGEVAGDSSGIGLGVTPDERRRMNDSGYLQARQQLDSAVESGATVNQGIDSAAAMGAAAARNDPNGDATVRSRQHRKP